MNYIEYNDKNRKKVISFIEKYGCRDKLEYDPIGRNVVTSDINEKKISLRNDCGRADWVNPGDVVIEQEGSIFVFHRKQN